MTGCWYEYRNYVARNSINEQLTDLPISVGVSGIIAHQDYILFAKRSKHVMSYPGFWELAPSGAVDDQFLNPDTRTIDLAAQILCELEEETELTANIISEITPFAYVLDNDQTSPSYEIFIKLIPTLSLFEIRQHFQHVSNTEYESFIVVPTDQITSFFKIHSPILPTSMLILEFLRMI